MKSNIPLSPTSLGASSSTSPGTGDPVKHLKPFWRRRPFTFFGALLLPLLLALGYVFIFCILHLLRFRNNFAAAPTPLSPAHGVVIAIDHDANIANSSIPYYEEAVIDEDEGISQVCDIFNNNTCTPHQFKTYKNTHPVHHRYLYHPEYPPLRLLVVGDSIARGVGSQSCLPIFPQSLAAILSKALKGRPVFWTSMGEPGATTQMLAEQIEMKRHVSRDHEGEFPFEQEWRGIGRTNFPDAKGETIQETQDMAVIAPQSLTTGPPSFHDSIDNRKQWIQKLQYHKTLHHALPYGDYDVVILLTGANDVKKSLTPQFILQDEITGDIGKLDDGRGEHKELDDLQKIFSALGHQMKAGLKQSYEKAKAKAEDSIEKVKVKAGMKVPEENEVTDEYWDHDIASSSTSLASSFQTDEDEHEVEQRRSNTGYTNEDGLKDQSKCQQLDVDLPLLVMPSFPVRHVPLRLQMDKLSGRVALLLSKLMEANKKRVADQYFDSVFVADELNPEMFSDFRDKKGEIFHALTDETDIILSLNDVDTDQCAAIEEEMRQFYSKHAPVDPKFPAGYAFSPDHVHPNDFGYDVFARFMGTVIAKRWEKKNSGVDQVNQKCSP